MIQTFPSDSDVTIKAAFKDSQGAPMTPASASYSVYRRGGEVVAQTIIVLSQGDTEAEITIPALHHSLSATEVKDALMVEVEYVDDLGNTQLMQIIYGIEARVALQPGLNSFALYEELIMLSADVSNLKIGSSAFTDTQRKSALVGAYLNLINLPYSYQRMSLTTEDELFSVETLGKLLPSHRQRLIRAQLIEADNILGGNPIEDRRKAGMISDSAGESAHFFRSGKPLSLPCCRRAAEELGPMLNWSLSISR